MTETHEHLPYEVTNPPQPVRVHTPQGVEHGLLVGRWERQALVLHGDQDTQRISWLPTGEIRLVAAIPLTTHLLHQP